MGSSELVKSGEGERGGGWLALSCPLCGGAGAVRFSIRGHDISSCGICHHEYTESAGEAEHVAAIYDESYFSGKRGGYGDYMSGSDDLRRLGATYGALLGEHRRPGRLLDVGCAAGFMLQGFESAGWQGVGVEPNAVMAAHAREALGLDVHCGTLSSIELDEPVDAVSVIQVLPHLIDPVATLRQVWDLLATDGLLLVEAWNRRSRIARVMGERWYEYNPPSVLHWFDPPSLVGAAERSGFDLLRIDRAPRRVNVATLRHMLHSVGRTRIASLLAHVDQRRSFPHPGDDVFWALFQRRG